jgi:hypothetical protein
MQWFKTKTLIHSPLPNGLWKMVLIRLLKMKKQRPLTDIQLTVLKMKLDGKTNYQISDVLGIHPATVSCKYSDLKRGIAKGAYNNLPSEMRSTGDLFQGLSND